VTFNKEIAPILFQNCAPCHRPGQSAPFALLSYAEARKHAGEMVRATQKRYMPPWLPEEGYGEFLDQRRLTADQIGLIQQWAAEGTSEGKAEDLPPAPKFNDGWQLGEPDLVVELPQPYLLAAEGRDLYRNFLIPLHLGQSRFVQGLEFHPNNRSVHHVRILLDSTQQSRRLEGEDGQPGFGGMNVPAKFPPGHLLTWTPGKIPAREPAGLAWVLEKDADVVLQIHMQRTGKEELIRPSLGFYFTDQPPSKSPCRIGLLSELIDIPAGQKDYVVERTFELPADADVLAVLPHLHYLGKELQGYAMLPDGQKQWLLWIRQWDFNWQSEFRYRQPVFLPQGSIIYMRYTYDNSEENPRNPNHPARHVSYGPQSVDEMGELWLQLLPRRAQDAAVLEQAHRIFSATETAHYYEHQLLSNPTNASTHLALGKVLGPIGQMDEALRHFRIALDLDPNLVEGHYYLAMTLYTQGQLDQARTEFESTLHLAPSYFRAHDGLGLVNLRANDSAQAKQQFEEALRLNPADDVARQHLQRLADEKGAGP
jgi:tetratricopeptide (TPR) repeat protein